MAEMHEQAVLALANRLREIAEELVYPDGLPHAGQKIVGGADPVSAFSITDAGAELRTGLADDLYAKFSARFSNSYIDRAIGDILWSVAERRDTSPVEPELRRFVSHFNQFSTSYLVILPVVGVRLGATPIKLGHATFRKYDEATCREVAERCRAIVEANPGYTTEWKAKYIDRVERDHLSRLRDFVCSEIEIAAEPIRAKEIALDHTRLALDLLRYAILFLYTTEPRDVGVLGDVSEDHLTSFAICTNNQSVHYGSEVRNRPLELDERTVDRMRRIGVFELSDLILKPDKTDFEDMLLQAVRWLGSAQSQAGNDNALLNLVTFLETIFRTQHGAPISATIAEGVAMLTVSDLAGRKKRKKRVTEFYGKRSRLTHTGQGVVTNDELLELTLICRDLTLLLIRHKASFAKHDEFRDWLEEQKLGGAIAFPS